MVAEHSARHRASIQVSILYYSLTHPPIQTQPLPPPTHHPLLPFTPHPTLLLLHPAHPLRQFLPTKTLTPKLRPKILIHPTHLPALLYTHILTITPLPAQRTLTHAIRVAPLIRVARDIRIPRCNVQGAGVETEPRRAAAELCGVAGAGHGAGGGGLGGAAVGKCVAAVAFVGVFEAEVVEGGAGGGAEGDGHVVVIGEFTGESAWGEGVGEAALVGVISAWGGRGGWCG